MAAHAQSFPMDLKLVDDVLGAPSDRELNLRRRICDALFLKRENFPGLVEFNDFLEDREDIIFSLAENVNIDDAKRRLDAWTGKYKREIADNQNQQSLDSRRKKAAEREREKVAAVAAGGVGSLEHSSLVEPPGGPPSSVPAPAPVSIPVALPLRLAKSPSEVQALIDAVNDDERRRRAWLAGGYRMDYFIERSRRDVESSLFVVQWE